MTVKLDITKIKESNLKLYPTMIYYITKVVNNHSEFKTALNMDGHLVIYDELVPCYTVFNKDTETFSNMWTEYNNNYDGFLEAYENDISMYGKKKGMIAKPNIPENNFPISMIPWRTFEGFNLCRYINELEGLLMEL